MSVCVCSTSGRPAKWFELRTLGNIYIKINRPHFQKLGSGDNTLRKVGRDYLKFETVGMIGTDSDWDQLGTLRGLTKG